MAENEAEKPTLGEQGTADKVHGKIEQAAGTVQRKAGEVLGNTDMQAEGAGHEIKGGAQAGVGNVEKKVDETLNP